MFLMLMPRCQMKEEQAVPLSPLLPEQHHQETCWGFHCNHLSDHFSTRSEPFWQHGMCGHPKGHRDRGECPALLQISQLKQPQRHEGWDSRDIQWPLHSLEDAHDRPVIDGGGRLGKILWAITWRLSEGLNRPKSTSLQQQQTDLLVQRETERSCGGH